MARDRVLAKYKMLNVERTPYGTIAYQIARRGRLVYNVLPKFRLAKLKQQGITQRDILSGNVEVWEHPRADITGERTPRGFMTFEFVKVNPSHSGFKSSKAKIHRGPRGGKYRIRRGRKVYV